METPLTDNQLLIYREIEAEDITVNQLMEKVKLSRATIQIHVGVLVERKLVYQHGRARASFYSIRPKGVFPAKARDVDKPLPGLPKIMLDWLGYTDIKPDPLHARHIQ